jgi:hypothetical protein
MPSTGSSLLFPIVTGHVGGSVQHGLSAAGGVYGFNKHCSAADKRYSVGTGMHPSESLVRVSVSYKISEYITFVRECIQLDEAQAPVATSWVSRIWNSRTMQNLMLPFVVPPIFLIKKALVGDCTFEFTPIGLTRISKRRSGSRTWDQVRWVHALSSLYLIQLSEGFLPIPYRAFTPEQKVEFLRLVPAHLQKPDA